MTTFRNSLIFLSGAAIGLLAYHFLLLNKSSPTSGTPPFTLLSTSPEEDTAYKALFYSKNQNLSAESHFFSRPVDTSTLSRYVRNYKRFYPGGTFCFTLLRDDIGRLLEAGQDIRVYLGLKTEGAPTTGTIILTGVNTTGVNTKGGDVYFPIGGVMQAIDQASPCPSDCPSTLREAAANPMDVPAAGAIQPNIPLNQTKLMLGRLWDTDARQ